ncbi:DegT/DnrJ/EryC1/StrS family aminotransferase [Treponema sp.]|uniref:DegT/DnrJ/EryC1/StrS family aminotransferase n=1 Tax=Treponema sp. TaxID=166 RepID=UPI002A83C150|nr:DegT/DnrJ/EryC1/StrS family aminotransferase [Treponema sp.]MCI6442642.1 DegT/DnrJ/EryC1/StrS family aminotransferase [Spirochaetia bacterium]MDY4133447.1 DegT/DnrJ/EryC1/StrS family aminotransferase [Treponema sp.]
MSEDKMTVPFFKASIGKEEEDAAVRVLRSGWLTTGNEAHEFEKEFAAKTGAKHALAVNSNTSGMIMAMEACGVKAGKAVITTPYTFVSTAASARHLDADVYFADIEKDNYSIDPESIEKILDSEKGKNVVAIVPVHIAGNVCNMKRIMEIAKKHGVYVIEDCAHSFPSPTDLGFAGTIGDVGVFSFYATKTMTTGEGGMVTTNNDVLAKRMSQMRLHGMNRDAWDRYTSTKASWEYDIIAPGFKSNLPDILAAIGRVQLAKADEFDEKRKVHVEKYNREFSKLDFIKIPPTSKGDSRHLYLMRLNLEILDCDRNVFAKELQERGLGISMHFIPIFHFSYWKELYPDFKAENFPNAEEKYLETISLPLWPDMTEEMTDYVIECVKAVGEKHHV